MWTIYQTLKICPHSFFKLHHSRQLSKSYKLVVWNTDLTLICLNACIYSPPPPSEVVKFSYWIKLYINLYFFELLRADCIYNDTWIFICKPTKKNCSEVVKFTGKACNALKLMKNLYSDFDIWSILNWNSDFFSCKGSSVYAPLPPSWFSGMTGLHF